MEAFFYTHPTFKMLEIIKAAQIQKIRATTTVQITKLKII